MTRYFIVAILAALIGIGCAVAQDTALATPSGTTTSPAAGPAASQPASAPTSQPADPNVVKILKDLERVGEKFAALSADVNYRVVKQMVGDDLGELRTGKVIIARGGGTEPDRLYIRFDTLKQEEGPTIQDKIEYALDGQWLTEAKHRIKTLTRYQVTNPGEKKELFRLGQGPFPIPFGQKADDVMKYFQASTRPPIKSDPNGTVYVKLVTRPQYKEELNFLVADMWVDSTTFLPVKLVTANKNKDVSTAIFSNVQANEKVDAKQFVIGNMAGWQLNVVPLKKD